MISPLLIRHFSIYTVVILAKLLTGSIVMYWPRVLHPSDIGELRLRQDAMIKLPIKGAMILILGQLRRILIHLLEVETVCFVGWCLVSTMRLLLDCITSMLLLKNNLPLLLSLVDILIEYEEWGAWLKFCFVELAWWLSIRVYDHRIVSNVPKELFVFLL